MSAPNFLDFMKERDQLDEAFNSAPYELTMGKKNAGDVFFTFIDEDDKEYRIQFYTPQGLGKSVRQVFIGQKRGSVYPDAIARFKNPMRVIASMIEATKQYLATPLGKTIDGFAVNFSKKALERGMTLIPKIIRQSGLKQKLNVMDLTYSPVPDRGYVWLVKKGKDPAQVFDGPKMKGITWDDPDKIGDVPADTNTIDSDSTEGVKVPSNGKVITKTNSAFTIRWDMGFPPSGPYAGAVLETTVLRVRENDYVISTIASTKNKTLNDLKSYDYKGDINSLLKEEGERYSLANNQLSTLTSISYNPNKLGYDLVSVGSLGEVRFNGQDIGLPSNRQVVINAVAKMNDEYEKTGAVDQSNNSKKSGWYNEVADGGNPTISWYNAQGAYNGGIGLRFSPIYGVYSGSSVAVNFKEIEGKDVDALAKKLKLPPIPKQVSSKFVASAEAWWKQKNIVPPNTASQGNIEMIPTTDMGQEGLRDGGYIARLLGVIDTYAPQMVGMYSGEKLTRVGAGRYKTSGGLVIEVHFWGVDKGNLAVEVSSELSGTEMLSLSGKTKDAGMKIVEAISRAAGSQFNGEVEVRSVPINGAPYPILKVSRSQGYSYVDCGSFVLKVSDALLERFTVGKAVELDLMRNFPRTTFPVRYDWYSKTEMVVKASDGKTIFGSINTNASNKDAVITANLKEPSNGTFFGETVHGFSVAWDFKFPRGGNLQDAKIVTNVTYNFDKKKANITTMIVEGHHQHSSSSYDVNLDVKTVQKVLDEYSDRLKIVDQQLRNLDSSSYNPNKRFLNDVTISKSGEILFQGQSLTQSQNRQAVINALARAQSNAEKTKGDLAGYAASIEASAPKGRDLDWQVYLTNNGNSLQVDWEITFRRNTRVGAMKEFSAQVYSGNRYLEDVYADAKSRGYAPEQPNLMAMSDAQRSDDMATMNGEDAYSEYEQSIGGSLKINLK